MVAYVVAGPVPYPTGPRYQNPIRTAPPYAGLTILLRVNKSHGKPEMAGSGTPVEVVEPAKKT